MKIRSLFQRYDRNCGHVLESLTKFFLYGDSDANYILNLISFFVDKYIFDKMFMKIRSVGLVFARS